jgi:hypothetical protein
MRGPFLVGSGKSFAPLSRMHGANLRRASCSWALTLPPMSLGGCRSLHAPMAFFHAAVLGSSDEPLFIP